MDKQQDGISVRADVITAFALGAAHEIAPGEAETLAAAVEQVAAQVVAAEAALAAEPSAVAPAYLA